jgi:hypothetical protein
VVVSVGAAAIAIRKPAPTDIDPLSHHRDVVPLAGLTLIAGLWNVRTQTMTGQLLGMRPPRHSRIVTG